MATDSEIDPDAIAALPVFDAADYLDSEEMIQAYLAEFAEDDDPAVLAAAQEVVRSARARLAGA
jgi:DNA-binding phage protein